MDILGWHPYTEKNAETCQECRRIKKEIEESHGSTNAQYEDYHEPVPIQKDDKKGGKQRKHRRTKRKRTRRKSTRRKKVTQRKTRSRKYC